MTAGKAARLRRIGTGGRYLVVPMDHGITMGAVTGLVDLESTVDAVTRGGADAVLTQRGVADRVHPNTNGAGYICHLNGSTTIGPDEMDKRPTGTVEDAIRAGADAEAFAEDLGHAVRLAEELGADVVKTAYSGTADSFDSVVESTSLPVVIAGGSRGTDRETLEMVRGAMDAGADGVSMGRSIFQHEDPEAVTSAVSAVVHDDASAVDAAERAGLAVEA
ncbi:fructose-bisphosphate aldolase [Halobacteriales archaeon QH_8_68_33]|nr:MAG: fructose-bisphosphate aldolase [Halobacteriales archaeon QH_8_68_33]